MSIYDHLGNRKRSEGGGGGYGDAVCKGINAESANNFIVVMNSPYYQEDNYDIRVIKYTEYDYSHCPPIPNPWLLLTLHIGLSALFTLIGISYLIIKEKKRKINAVGLNK